MDASEHSINGMLEALSACKQLKHGLGAGSAYARSLAPWTIPSISGYDDTTCPRQTL